MKLDVHGSVHHCTIHKKNPTRSNSVSKFYYSIFIWSSTCFGWHTAHRQEPKTALAVSGFAYVEGCWTCGCWTQSSNYTSNNLPRTQNQRLLVRFRLLIMGGVSPETCWASYKYKIIKFWYTVLSCWIFLDEFHMKRLSKFTKSLIYDPGLQPDLQLPIPCELTCLMFLSCLFLFIYLTTILHTRISKCIENDVDGQYRGQF